MYGLTPYGISPYGAGYPLQSYVPPDHRIRLYYRNILESALSITVTSENASFPKYRLYDRQIGLLYKGSTAPSLFVVDVDQGLVGNQYPIDTVIVGPGHNLDGLLLRLLHRAVGGDWGQACAWTGIAGTMRQSFDLTLDRYWRLLIEAPSANPELTELWLTKKCELERGPSYGSDRGMEENINRLQSKAGQVQKIIWGLEKRARRFDFTKISESQRMELETLRVSGYAKNIWIEDLEGELFFAEILGGLGRFKYEPVGRWGLGMNVLEVLP
jgi:hypothetical protein